MLTIHDNNIYDYSVIPDEERIVLYTELQSDDWREYTDVVFTGAVAHHFEHVLRNNILFDIEPKDPDSLVRECAECFDRGRPHIWPIEATNNADLTEQLQRMQLRAFTIHSSLGLSGWILAKDMKLIAREDRWSAI